MILKVLYEKEVEVFWGFFSNISLNGVCCFFEEEMEVVLKIGVLNMNVFDVINKSIVLKMFCLMLIKVYGGVGYGFCLVYIKGLEDVIFFVIILFIEIVKMYGGYVIVNYLFFIFC